MIKAIIFDFDGVIAESAHIKTEAFREVFSKWPDIAEKAVAYHLKNIGVTRFKKFRYVYEELLNQTYTEKIGKELSDEFSKICFEKIKAAPLVEGVIDFLKENFKKYEIFVASAAPDNELRGTIAMKGLEEYFIEVFGHPKLKKDTVRETMQKYQYDNKEVVFVGDGASDKRAAEENQVPFILRRTSENVDLIDESKYIINDLTELAKTIELINFS